MAENMEQYMSKTRTDYGSGVDRPKIEDKDNFELKGQFLKELRTNTFSGSDHEDSNEHIKKVLKIVDLFHIPNITIDQLMLRAFPMSLTGAASRWLRNKPSGSITTWEDLKTKFLSKYCPPAHTTKKMKEINNFQQEPDENLYQAWDRFKELLMKCPQHYLTEMQESISTIVEADTSSIRRIGSHQYAVSTGQNITLMYETRQTTIPFPSRLNDCHCEDKNGSYGPPFSEAHSCGASHINKSIPRKEKSLGSFTLPCYINNVCFDNSIADLGASIPEELHPQVVPEEMTMDELPNDFIGLEFNESDVERLREVVITLHKPSPSLLYAAVLMMAEFLHLPNFRGCKVAAGTLLPPGTARVTHLTPPANRLEDIPPRTWDMKVAEMSCKKVLAEKEKKKRKAEAKATAKADDSDQVEKVAGKKRAGEEGTSRRKKRKMRQETPPINLDSKHVSSPIPLNHFKPLETLANEAHVSENAYAGRLDALRN
ncbi:copia protein [Tanacetum coccineum]